MTQVLPFSEFMSLVYGYLVLGLGDWSIVRRSEAKSREKFGACLGCD